MTDPIYLYGTAEDLGAVRATVTYPGGTTRLQWVHPIPMDDMGHMSAPTPPVSKAVSINQAVELMFDAFDLAEQCEHSLGYYNRKSGVVDAQAVEIVRALLAAGWQVPTDD